MVGSLLPGKLVLIAVGLLLIGFGLFYQSKRKKVIRNGIRTMATIRDYSAGPSGQYFYVYEYTIQGKKYTGTGNVGVERVSRNKIGKAEEIICQKDEPGKFVTAKDSVMALTMAVLAIAGVGLIFTGLFLI